MSPKVRVVGELIAIGEAAQVLGVSINTLRNWEKRGLIRPYRLFPHSHRRYDLAELLDLRRKR